MADAADAPPVLQELVNRCGTEIGQSVSTAYQAVLVQVDTMIRASFAHGVAEGLERAAQACEQVMPTLALHGLDDGLAGFLRDQFRMTAMSVEIPS